jgi:hypothetical protein
VEDNSSVAALAVRKDLGQLNEDHCS